MGMMQEFKEFAMKGNVVDLAVGVIIGGAFGKIVSSFVEDIIMPILGVAIGGVNFSNLAVTLKEATATTAAVTLNYGKFIQSIFDFLIIAFAIFMAIRMLNRLKREEKQEAAAEPTPPSHEELLLAEIRDILRKS